MNRQDKEVIKALAAVSVPTVGLIWMFALAYIHIGDNSSEIEDLQAQIHTMSIVNEDRWFEYERQQATDRIVNKDVEDLERAIRRLERHHHENGGPAHVD